MGYGLNLALDTPTVHKDEGDLYLYPLYVPWWLQCFHTTGSFFFVYWLAWYMKTIANEKFNETIYNTVVGGSMWAYLSHYLWIAVLAQAFVRPLKLDFWPAAPLLLVGTEILIILSEKLLKYIFGLFGKEKA